VIAVDTSAIIAIIQSEPEEDRLRTALEKTNGALISTCNALELQLVISGKRAMAIWDDVQTLLDRYNIVPRAFDEQQLRSARDAVLRYGKGRHKASLNFGDCFAYALAITENIPLLYTGNDFAHTDVTAA
jgi:ribonuclease VapC